jgi:hypothetical protein
MAALMVYHVVFVKLIGDILDSMQTLRKGDIRDSMRASGTRFHAKTAKRVTLHGETSKTVKSRITEHKEPIKREDSLSLPADHVINNDHRFDWTKTTVLNHANTREAHELKEPWHSRQKPAINRHIYIDPRF